MQGRTKGHDPRQKQYKQSNETDENKRPISSETQKKKKLEDKQILKKKINESIKRKTCKRKRRNKGLKLPNVREKKMKK